MLAALQTSSKHASAHQRKRRMVVIGERMGGRVRRGAAIECQDTVELGGVGMDVSVGSRWWNTPGLVVWNIAR